MGARRDTPDAQVLAVPDQEIERWCNRVAAELPVPLDLLRAEYDEVPDCNTSSTAWRGVLWSFCGASRTRRQSAPNPPRRFAAGGSGARAPPCAPSTATTPRRASTSATSRRTAYGRTLRPASRAQTSGAEIRGGLAHSLHDLAPQVIADGVVRPLAPVPRDQPRRAALAITLDEPFDLPHPHARPCGGFALPEPFLPHTPEHHCPVRFPNERRRARAKAAGRGPCWPSTSWPSSTTKHDSARFASRTRVAATSLHRQAGGCRPSSTSPVYCPLPIASSTTRRPTRTCNRSLLQTRRSAVRARRRRCATRTVTCRS